MVSVFVKLKKLLKMLEWEQAAVKSHGLSAEKDVVSGLRLWVHVLALPRPGCVIWESQSPSPGSCFPIYGKGQILNSQITRDHSQKVLSIQEHREISFDIVFSSWHLWHWGNIHLASSAKEPDLVRGHSVGGGAETGLGGGAWS